MEKGNSEEKILDLINESIEVKKKIGEEDILIIKKISEEIIDCLKRGNKVLICGNGGSGADSQHFAAELVGRFKLNRPGLAGLALTTDTSILTAVGNDFGYDEIFVKQVEGLGNEGDILFGISTSGNSGNILKAYDVAEKKGLLKISLLGKDGGQMKEVSDLSFIAKSSDTARIQETHIMVIHIVCELVESALFQ